MKVQWLRIQRHLLRGESAIASIGLVLAAILLLGMAGSTMLLMRSHRAALEETAAAQLQGLGNSLGAAIESLLEAGEVTATRRLLVQAAQAHGLEHGRVTLGDGMVIADADASRIEDAPLPLTFPRMLADAAAAPEQQPGVHREILRVPGRGEVLLELEMAAPIGAAAFFEAQTGVGAVGALCLVLLLAVYRHMRRRFRGFGAVRDVLLALSAGEKDPGALRVSETFGEEAVAWNRVMAEREEAQRRMLMRSPTANDAQRTENTSDLEGICDAMWQGLILTDDTLTIRYANGAAALLLQFPREQIIGAALERAIADQHILEPAQAVARGQRRQRMSVELVRDGESGHTILRFTVRPVRRADKAAVMIVIEDITQQRVAEEAHTTFVAQATHELRMPLTNIRLYVENAIDEGERDPVVRTKCLNVINQESRRLERIVGDMLSVTEIEAGIMKLRTGDVRLEALLRELQGDYQAQADDKRIQLHFALSPKLPVIKGDRDKLCLTLHNLLGNALKYTPEGGKVTLSADIIDGRLVVEVADTGLGISEEEQELIFDKFYRSKDQRIAGIPGSGLGLALAREVMRLHGGNISVRSQLNEGSTFTVSVPVLAEAA